MAPPEERPARQSTDASNTGQDPAPRTTVPATEERKRSQKLPKPPNPRKVEKRQRGRKG